MKNIIPILLIFVIVLSCSSSKKAVSGGKVEQELKDPNTFLITVYSKDVTYGFTEKNPVKVGGAANSQGPLNERRFLNALAGPDGEQIAYTRAGSCSISKPRIVLWAAVFWISIVLPMRG